MNYFVSQPVGLDFNSGSGFCKWVWILPMGLDLPVGLDMKTPWARLPAVPCDLHTTMQENNWESSLTKTCCLRNMPSTYQQEVEQP